MTTKNIISTVLNFGQLVGVSRYDRRAIYRYRQLYLTYQQIVEAVTPQLEPLVGEMVPADLRSR